MIERSPTADRAAGTSVQADSRSGAAELLKTASPQGPPIKAPLNQSSSAVVDTLAEEFEDKPSLLSDLLSNAPSWLTSVVAHLSLVLLLALITSVQALHEIPKDVVVSADRDGPGTGDLEELRNDSMQISEELQQSPALSPPLVSDLPQAGPQVTDFIGPISALLPKPDLAPHALGAGDSLDSTGGSGSGDGSGNSLELRLNPSSRAEMVRKGGGTPQSEYAVAQALHWLAEHQLYDGSWTFEHQKSPKCHGSCRDPGFAPGKIAATSLALLPFLGTGQTHREGQYKKTIDSGLRFLIRSMEIQGDLGSLHELGGQMYGHGLGAIVLCEAYGMTHDQFLQTPAQAAVNFIVAAQDKVGGGWRYVPGQPGDTSVLGWQLMALKSAKLAYLRVPPVTMQKAGYFLDSVQSDKGATYGYKSPEARRPATTAIGLLCRMYLGWKKDYQPLAHGVHILGQLGPSVDKNGFRNNMYYNYYATQVMHHFGGYPWEQWNRVMREYLIESQAKRGHENGSWFFEGEDHGGPAGGRLYHTAMAAMTLEVYYRYMPLYREQSVKGTPGRD